MYLVRVGFTNQFGAWYHFDFECDTDDHAVAINEAYNVFCSGLTESELEAAARTLEILAHPNYLPPVQR